MAGLKTQDGRTLTYARKGSGPLLVCHPGGPGFSSSYLADLGGLDEELELVLLDPRGTGGSDAAGDPSAYAIDDYASDLEELREHLGVERMLLLGHSHGGVAAIAYASKHPDRVERLILASTLPRHGPDQEAAMQAAIEERAGEPWYEDALAALKTELEGTFVDGRELMELVQRMMPLYFARYGAAERAYIEALNGEELCVDATRLWEKEIFEHFDLRPQLPSLTMPTLVITGELDFITGPSCAAELTEGIPSPETVVLPGAGHMIFVEAPEEFREGVLSFLSGALA
ncbi:MAG: proline iminopeptidase [Gaiellaceae bacterium]|nr:proline iminopeptidase [Gaiellaceae bacterium]